MEAIETETYRLLGIYLDGGRKRNTATVVFFSQIISPFSLSRVPAAFPNAINTPPLK